MSENSEYSVPLNFTGLREPDQVPGPRHTCGGKLWPIGKPTRLHTQPSPPPGMTHQCHKCGTFVKL
jgi:hypothetical protein